MVVAVTDRNWIVLPMPCKHRPGSKQLTGLWVFIPKQVQIPVQTSSCSGLLTTLLTTAALLKLLTV